MTIGHSIYTTCTFITIKQWLIAKRELWKQQIKNQSETSYQVPYKDIKFNLWVNQVK